MKWIRKFFSGTAARPAISHDANAKIELSPGIQSPQRAASSLPKTTESALACSGFSHELFFDPALKQFANSFRVGEVNFDSADLEQRWNTIRSKVLHHILRLLSSAECANHLVLRGSVLLHTWLGGLARRPGDLDWVVVPQDWRINQSSSQNLLNDIVERLRGTFADDSLLIPDAPFAMDEIWMYEKNPGWRVMVPWENGVQKLNGTIQMDFVFGEYMPSAPQLTDVVIERLPPVSVRSASIEQSLAWKLLWLATDSYAMGKDLYDAVLLAESASLGADLLRYTFQVVETEHFRPFKNFDAEQVRGWEIEWDDFIKEHPKISGTVVEWKERLVSALAPLFQEVAEANAGFPRNWLK